ncbi:MAG: hypothetical protein HQM16_18290 [Deltaproteobacteria bacterium]|nr:hypothetical protein [Deltaproteobacteria bacterium]
MDIDKIILAWASGGSIDPEESAALHLNQNQTNNINGLLRDGYFNQDQINKSRLSKKLKEALLSVAQNTPFAPISAYINEANQNPQNFDCADVNPFVSFESRMSESPELLTSADPDLIKGLFMFALKAGRSAGQCWGYPRELLFTFERAGIDWAPLVYPLLTSTNDHERELATKWLKQRTCANTHYPDEILKTLKHLSQHDPQENVRIEAQDTLGIYEFCKDPNEVFLTDKPIYQASNECLNPPGGDSVVQEIQESRAFMVQRYGLDDATHPLFDIINYSPNDFVLDDFRSAHIFESLAKNEWTEDMCKDRMLTLVYPGAGSHMASLVVALKLIDQNKIDAALLTHTDLESYNVLLVGEYLKWFEKHGLISGLDVTQRTEGEGTRHFFRFNYREKPVELQYLVNLGSDGLWTTPESLDHADLVVFHDGPTLEVQMNIVKKIHGSKNKDRDQSHFFVTARDYFEDYPPQRNVDDPTYMLDARYSLKGLPFKGKMPLPSIPLFGSFGCYGGDHLPETLYRQTPRGLFKDDRYRNLRSYQFDPKGKLNFHSSPYADNGAYLVRITDGYKK